MTQPAPRGDEVEVLLASYATACLAPDSGQLARGRVAMFAAHAGAASVSASAGGSRRSLLRGWSLAAAFALLLVGSSGLVAAQSGPGQPFYGLRLAIGSLTLSGDEPAHERGLAAQLEDRLNEVGAAARIGDGRGAQAAIREYLNTLRQLTRNGVTDPAILALIHRHEDTLQELLTVAPEQATRGVRQALEAAGKVGVVPATESAVPRPTPQHGDGQSAPGTGKP